MIAEGGDARRDVLAGPPTARRGDDGAPPRPPAQGSGALAHEEHDPARTQDPALADFARFAAMPLTDRARPGLREELLRRHLQLADHLARRFTGRGEPHDDLVQVATIGLIKALDRFDPSRGVPFPAYAIPTMLGEVKRHFRDRGWALRVPRRLQETGRALADAREALTHELGRAPTIAELAARTGRDADEVVEVLESANAYSTVPLDAASPDSGAAHLGSVDDRLERVDNREALRPLLAQLPARERRILALRFVRGMSQSQIAAEVGISQMHVSRLLSRTLAQLREGLGEEDG